MSSGEGFKSLLQYISPKVNSKPKLDTPIETPKLFDMPARSDISGEASEVTNSVVERDLNTATVVKDASHPAKLCKDKEEVIAPVNFAHETALTPNDDESALRSPNEATRHTLNTDGKLCDLSNVIIVEKIVVEGGVASTMGVVINTAQEVEGAGDETKRACQEKTNVSSEDGEQTRSEGEQEKSKAGDQQSHQSEPGLGVAVHEVRDNTFGPQQLDTKTSSSEAEETSVSSGPSNDAEKTGVSSGSSTDGENGAISSPPSDLEKRTSQLNGEAQQSVPPHLRPSLQGCPRASDTQASTVSTPLNISLCWN
jgi:hypothetical protein